MANVRGLRVCVHIIFDGHSTEPISALMLLEKLERQVEEIGAGQIVSGVGRGIALNHDGNYAKMPRAFEAMVWGKAAVRA